MWILYVIIALAGVGILYWWFAMRKPEGADELPGGDEPKRLEGKTEQGRTSQKKDEPKPAPKKEPAKAEAKPQKEEPKPAAKKEESKADPKKEEPEPIAESSEGEKVEPVEAASDAAQQEPEAAALTGEKLEPTAVAERARDVEGLRKGLGKSRAKEGFFGRLAKLITGRKEIDPDIVDEIEEVLITSDVGVQTAEAILEKLRDGLKKKELDDPDKVWAALREEARRILSVGDGGLTLRTKPTVVLLVGVNGSGKTTTIGKLATQLKADGREVMLAAGDTFRAAAVQQLQVWGRRVGCEVVKGKDGADPGAVIFDAIKKAAEGGADVVLADTAGRLHTKSPLMDELKKVARTMGKAMEGAPHEIFLVIDATNGQNAVAQSRQFAEALPLTGIVLTKLDGTAKGGVVLGICDELKVPVRYIGIGERADDLRPFDVDEFVEALLGGGEAEDMEAA